MTRTHKGQDPVVASAFYLGFVVRCNWFPKGITSAALGAGSRGAEAELWPGVPARPVSHLG